MSSSYLVHKTRTDLAFQLILACYLDFDLKKLLLFSFGGGDGFGVLSGPNLLFGSAFKFDLVQGYWVENPSNLDYASDNSGSVHGAASVLADNFIYLLDTFGCAS